MDRDIGFLPTSGIGSGCRTPPEVPLYCGSAAGWAGLDIYLTSGMLCHIYKHLFQ